jgi:hypothetical protein
MMRQRMKQASSMRRRRHERNATAFGLRRPARSVQPSQLGCKTA